MPPPRLSRNSETLGVIGLRFSMEFRDKKPVISHISFNGENICSPGNYKHNHKTMVKSDHLCRLLKSPILSYRKLLHKNMG